MAAFQDPFIKVLRGDGGRNGDENFSSCLICPDCGDEKPDLPTYEQFRAHWQTSHPGSSPPDLNQLQTKQVLISSLDRK